MCQIFTFGLLKMREFGHSPGCEDNEAVANHDATFPFMIGKDEGEKNRHVREHERQE